MIILVFLIYTYLYIYLFQFIFLSHNLFELKDNDFHVIHSSS